MKLYSITPIMLLALFECDDASDAVQTAQDLATEENCEIAESSPVDFEIEGVSVSDILEVCDLLY